MTRTWRGDDTPDAHRIGPVGWLLVLLRGPVLVAVTFGSLVVLLIVRLVEWPAFGRHRPLTPWITQFVCRTAFVILGIRRSARGRPMPHAGAMVANHVSWLDIFTLNAFGRFYFVAKSEVASWPAIGWLARANGTVFVERRQGAAHAQALVFRDRLRAGHKLLFFPEGTSTDGLRVLDFKSTLFAAFFEPELRSNMWIQPVTQVYRAPDRADERFYGWWGEMTFGAHLLKVLAQPRQGSVHVIFHDPVRAADYADRKALAQDLSVRVRDALVANAG